MEKSIFIGKHEYGIIINNEGVSIRCIENGGVIHGMFLPLPLLIALEDLLN